MVFLKMHKKFFIETFGCQMNVHDSEKIAGVLSGEGYTAVNNPREAGLIVFNTCSIRQKAEQKFFSELGRMKSLKKRRPDLRIAVAGCIAQQQGKGILEKAPYVDYIFGPQNIHLLRDALLGQPPVIMDRDNPFIAENDLPVLRSVKGRAWVTVMYGCDNYCTYCIVPYTRGRERSRPSANVLREILELAKGGCREVTLLGQNVNSYRSDIDFPGILREIDSIEGIERIRFVTSHPRDLSERLISAMADLGKVCEHLHLPLQSGSSRVLERMGRGYSYGQYLSKVKKLREKVPGISLTADIIAGFPGETRSDHEQTVRALKEIEFDGIFAFKFSPRPGTTAASLDGRIDETTKAERLSEILEVQDMITLKLNNNLVNSIFDVLVEGYNGTEGSVLMGRTRGNKIVHFEGDGSVIGEIITVKVMKAHKHSLSGALA
jgi:tRNA-2-methylthio-N6-dimethylallyladenosine synthase